MIRKNHISKDFYDTIQLYNDSPENFAETPILTVDFFDFFIFEDFSTNGKYYLGNIKIKKEFANKITINYIMKMHFDSFQRHYNESTCYHGNKSFIIQFVFNYMLNYNIYEIRFYRNYMKNNISKINYMDLKKSIQRVEKII